MAICLGLLGLLAFQLRLRQDRGKTPEAEGLEILRSGAPLSNIGGGRLKSRMTSGCRPVYFVDPLCPGSFRLAEEWKAIGSPTSTWVISRDADLAWAFAAKHGLPSPDVVLLADVDGMAPELRDLGVHAAPTTAVLDSLGILRHVRGGPRVVPDEVLARYCN